MKTPTPVAAPLTKLGRYEILERLALGGMAEVYLATHGELTGFRTLVVVKKVLPHLAENPQFIAMFLDEARIAALLDHPNVARIFEVGKAGHEYFLAMELVQGRSLSGLHRRSIEMEEPIDSKIAALIIANAAHGLHHAHQLSDAEGNRLGLVHRDVSPQNILISFEGSVKVIDFGIARALGRLSDTTSGGTKGKIGYMSPEQARGEDVDHRSDIFALGVVLWETIAGRRLFSRESEFNTMKAIIELPIARPSSFAQTPQALDDIVMKALARDPGDRFQSAEEMALALERYTFSSGGVGTSDLAALMKFFFGEEYARWKSTVRMVLDSAVTSDAIPTINRKAATVTATLVPPTLFGRHRSTTTIAALAAGALVMGALGLFSVRALMRPPVKTAVTVPEGQPAGAPRISIEPLPGLPAPQAPPVAAGAERPTEPTPEVERPLPTGSKSSAASKTTPKRRPAPAHVRRGEPRGGKPKPPLDDRRPNPF